MKDRGRFCVLTQPILIFAQSHKGTADAVPFTFFLINPMQNSYGRKWENFLDTKPHFSYNNIKKYSFSSTTAQRAAGRSCRRSTRPALLTWQTVCIPTVPSCSRHRILLMVYVQKDSAVKTNHGLTGEYYEKKYFILYINNCYYELLRLRKEQK